MEIRNDGKRVGRDVSAEGFGMEEGGKGAALRLAMIVQHVATESGNPGPATTGKPS